MSSDRTDGESISELESLDIERRRLEVDKLRAEIEQVRLAWWKRPGYLGGLVPIVIAIVGFSSAWISGYFDTQRQNLKNEISSLEGESGRLNVANQEIQRRIDDAYLRLKVASSEASYSLSHVQGLPSGESSRERIKAASGSLPPDVANAINDLIERSEFIDMIIEMTDGGLEDLNNTLKGIPASPWATELSYIPFPDQNILIAPDGRFYHIERRKYYTPEEFDRILEAESSN